MAKYSFFGQSLKRRHNQPTNMWSEEVYLLIIFTPNGGECLYNYIQGYQITSHGVFCCIHEQIFDE